MPIRSSTCWSSGCTSTNASCSRRCTSSGSTSGSKRTPGWIIVPRTFLFGAKAAPGYHMAKRIIKLIHSVARRRQPGSRRGRPSEGRSFPPISTCRWPRRSTRRPTFPSRSRWPARKASGTGNMKFALNGAVTVGTLDGANVEIRERVGERELLPVRADGRRSLPAESKRATRPGTTTTQ